MATTLSIEQLFLQEGIRALLTVCAGGIVAYVGLRVYFLQKEYELVKQRYLENSIDVICAELDNARGVFLHNITHCIHAAKEFKYAKNNFNSEFLAQQFLPFPSLNFHTVAHERLRTLSGSNVYLLAYQKALSHQLALNNVVTKEIPYAFKRKLIGEIQEISFETISETIDAQLIELVEETNKHVTTISSLHALSAQLEHNRLSLEKVRFFSTKKQVVKIVKEFEAFFSSIPASPPPRNKIAEEIGEKEQKQNG